MSRSPATTATPRPRSAGAPAATGARALLVGAARASAVRTSAIALCGLAAAGAAVALPAALGRTLDLLLAGAANTGPWLVLCAALLTADVLCEAATALLVGTVTARSAGWIRRRALRHVLAAGPPGAARCTSGDLVTRLTGNVTEAAAAPAAAAAALPSLVLPAGGLVALALIDAWTAAVLVAGAPALLLLLRSFSRDTSTGVARYQRAQGDIAARLVEALGGARTIAAAGTQERERTRILAPMAELDARGRQVWRVYGRAVARSTVLLPLLETAVLAVGGLRLAAGELTVGELLAVLRYAALAGGLGAVVGQLAALLRSRAAARRTAELVSGEAMEYGSRELPPNGPGRLEFRDVTVVHDGRTVLQGIDLVVPGGTTLAVVGRSGAGKTALAAVAGRLADPAAGQVLLDGVPLAQLGRRTLRREVGYAFERPALFGETVSGAIAFGPYEPDAPRLTEAARAAGADAFVRRLPQGYRSALDEAPLSGGEMQRLGLARAFAHAGRLLVLDDATSSLDSATERHVVRALLHDVRSGTRLVVAHRASSAARADLVAWLEGGTVRAVGRHEQLWQLAAYREVFAAESNGGDVREAGDDPRRAVR
ncbi:ABC transporter transmembrane domain-containing protein [Streptomyces sp. NPDC059176]|uniref:ABC transporter transmembrane domain-containing protein n=1 Tax=Streptomyces sp. NPDC059176 TaxID=3346758 RepID=UPI00369CFBDF